MKMKSYFSGFNAKMALALLAISGTVLTGCYEKEDGDVPFPYVPLDATYTAVVTVTDENGLTDATVTATGLSFTSADGAYTATTKESGTYEITATKTGYEPKKGSITFEKANAGEKVVKYLNIALASGSSKDDLQYTYTSKTTTKPFTFNASDEEYATLLDFVNDHNNKKDLLYNIKVASGLAYDANELPAAYKEEITNILTNIYGTISGNKEFELYEEKFPISLAPFTALVSITVETTFIEDTYVFTKGNEEVATISVKNVTKNHFRHATRSFSHGHGGTGHGHDHGHGNNLNAGGGIWDSL